jgi:hypothetical protein
MITIFDLFYLDLDHYGNKPKSRVSGFSNFKTL